MVVLRLGKGTFRYAVNGTLLKFVKLIDHSIAESLVSQRRYDNLGEVDTR